MVEPRMLVLIADRGSTPFDLLPEDWVRVIHNSGMPVFLNRKARVCTLSRPYFLGTGSVRVSIVHPLQSV